MKKTKKAFISGIFGQDGAYLARLLLNKGYDIVGGSRRPSLDKNYRLRALGISDKIKIIPFDLTDPYCVSSVVENGAFDEFYNLGAQSFVSASWDIPLQTSQVDAIGPLLILEAIRRCSPATKFYQASTSEMFGGVRETVQSEMTPFHPRSPYGVAKQFAHFMTVNYRESFDLHATSGILFNHESPLRGNKYITKKISRQFNELKRGIRSIIQLGNLDASRDWGFADEYVYGMWLMLQQDEPEDYVLATGKTHSVRTFVELVAKALDYEIFWEGTGINEKGYNARSGELLIEVDPQYFRPTEINVSLGDASKAKKKLGWEAKLTLAELVDIMVDFDLKELER